MQAFLPSRDLVLIGAGHTNLHVVRMWRMQPIPDVRLTLVSPFSRATYSGMLPGTLAGQYRPEEMEIDLYRFTADSDIRLLIAPAVGLDPSQRLIHLADRPPIRFDVASIGLGSVPAGQAIWRTNPAVLSIKPMATFRQRLEERLRLTESDPVRITVVGGGAGGVEITFCLGMMLQQRGTPATLTLIEAGEEILSGYASGTIRRVRAEFDRRGVIVQTNRRLTEEHIQAHEGDLFIWAVSAAPPEVFNQFDLPKADDGFLAVRPTLQTTAEEPVFAVGDSATLVDEPVRKAGVYAVREGPILWENIQRFFQNRELIPYRPQRGFLTLLNTGDGQAIGEYKGFSAHGRWLWRWKNYLDRKFMRLYQDYRAMSVERHNDDPPSTVHGPRSLAMRCRGCGGKVGARVLANALGRLEVPTGAIARQGLDRPDDAALLNPEAGPADVLTVDFFQAFLDDPYFVGRIAALNALSDVWAMGGDPAGALAMVTLPQGLAHQQEELLYLLLAGGLRELTTAGVTLLGGHTLEGSELTVGYTVVGQLQGREPFTKGKLRPGDRLILTKPLGSGVLLAAIPEAKARGEWIDALLRSMLLSNGPAATVARDFDVSGVTDVTGFGLAGHLFEMLQASRVSAQLNLADLPLLNGVADLSRDGIRSTLDPANRGVEAAIRATPEAKTAPDYQALFDPQTSGGLLLAVAPAQSDAMVDALRWAGYQRAKMIGTVIEGGAEIEMEVR